jgi:hypothetical protein
MDTLEEMQYISVRDEMRTRLAAFYGVSNVFMMDTGKSGGLNNEGLQVLVTNRAVEFGHKVYTENLFPRLMEEMDVHDWKLTLYPNEEEDEVTRLRRDEMEVNIAQRMAQLGYQAELIEEGGRDIRFIYKKQEMPPGAPQGGGPPMGGMGQPGALPTRNIPPQLAGALAGQANAGMAAMNPGGQGVGLRNRGPASPQNFQTAGSGSPIGSVQQRGPPASPLQQARDSTSGF